MKRKAPLKQRTPLARTKTLKPKAFVKRMGPVAKERYQGNLLAKQHYFRGRVIAPCQSCGTDLSQPYAQSHHKRQSGEEIANKLILCERCHISFVHDQAHPEHRKAAELCEATAYNGKRVDWQAFGLGEAFGCFTQNQPQPKGVPVPGKQLKCQGCRIVPLVGTGQDVYSPCLVHAPEAYKVLFDAPEKA